VAFVAAAACLLNQFTSDDFALIGADQRIRGAESFAAIFTRAYWPPPFAPDLYRPIATALLAIQFAVGGGDPFVFRLVSIVLYAAASVGVYLLARRLCAKPVALAVALVFAAHPVHVEAIALAVSQNESIVALLTVLSVTYYLDRRRKSPGSVGTRGWIVLGAMYAVASLSKEQGLVLPAFLIAAELTLVREESPRSRVAKLGAGYASLFAVGALLLLLRASVLGGQLRPPVIAEALRGAGFGERLLTMLQIVPQWLRLIVWPVHLRLDYGFKEILPSSGFGGVEAFGAVILAAVIAAAWIARKRAPVVTFGLLWAAMRSSQ
jgi:protein O-mannosyl-transferase